MAAQPDDGGVDGSIPYQVSHQVEFDRGQGAGCRGIEASLAPTSSCVHRHDGPRMGLAGWTMELLHLFVWECRWKRGTETGLHKPTVDILSQGLVVGNGGSVGPPGMARQELQTFIIITSSWRSLEKDSAVNTGWTLSGWMPWEQENRQDDELRSRPGQGEGARKIDYIIGETSAGKTLPLGYRYGGKL